MRVFAPMTYPTRSVLFGVSAFMLVSLSAGGSNAAIFAKNKLWPSTPNAGGKTVIPVCIEADSSTTQKRSGIYSVFIYDRNPGLDEVVQHVRGALAASWESVSAVQFTDWRSCTALNADEQSQAVRVYIHPDAPNASVIGTDARGASRGVNFKPWASESTANLCINYNAATTHMQYDFSCVEQYAIHEFGHALGFLHEWYNPATPSACTAQKQKVQSNDWGPPLSGYDSQCLGGGAECLTTNPTVFDDRSIMTYDSPCANVHGVRFGSTTLDNWDAIGAWAAYPIATGSDFVGTGFGLLPGNSIHSPNGQYTLTLQVDGNLVLYDGSGNATWATGTWGQKVDYALMQSDGNLVVYGSGIALWASGTNTQHARLFLQDDGNLVMSTLTPIWSTRTNEHSPLVGDGSRGLRAGEWLWGGSAVSSNSGAYSLAMQTDGNLVVYRDTTALWSSGTQGQTGAAATMQQDGNFVVYSAGGSAPWASGTNGSASNPLLSMQDDGNVVLYSRATTWATNTH